MDIVIVKGELNVRCWYSLWVYSNLYRGFPFISIELSFNDILKIEFRLPKTVFSNDNIRINEELDILFLKSRLLFLEIYGLQSVNP